MGDTLRDELNSLLLDAEPRFQAGQHNEALAIVGEMVRRAQNVAGDESYEYAESLRIEARMIGLMGNFAESLGRYRRVLGIVSKLREDASPIKLASLVDVNRIRRQLGKPVRSESVCENAKIAIRDARARGSVDS